MAHRSRRATRSSASRRTSSHDAPTHTHYVQSRIDWSRVCSLILRQIENLLTMPNREFFSKNRGFMNKCSRKCWDGTQIQAGDALGAMRSSGSGRMSSFDGPREHNKVATARFALACRIGPYAAQYFSYKPFCCSAFFKMDQNRGAHAQQSRDGSVCPTARWRTRLSGTPFMRGT